MEISLEIYYMLGGVFVGALLLGIVQTLHQLYQMGRQIAELERQRDAMLYEARLEREQRAAQLDEHLEKLRRPDPD